MDVDLEVCVFVQVFEEIMSVEDQIQEYLRKIAELQEENKRLAQDNQELRDLCCFLDDDRQKGKRLAREWQKFGRYTAKVMRQEVVAYQKKLQQLDGRQAELLRDNYELKDLCLYLDEERSGKSTSSSTDQDNLHCPKCGFTILEEPASMLASPKTVSQTSSSEGGKVEPMFDDSSTGSPDGDDLRSESRSSSDCNENKSEQTLRAFEVLGLFDEQATDVGAKFRDAEAIETEKAILKEMCNVIQRTFDGK